MQSNIEQTLLVIKVQEMHLLRLPFIALLYRKTENVFEKLKGKRNVL